MSYQYEDPNEEYNPDYGDYPEDMDCITYPSERYIFEYDGDFRELHKRRLYLQ